MFQEMLAAGSGGGSNNCEVGTITLSGGAQTITWQSITTKPSKLFLYKLSIPMANMNLVNIYDESIESAKQLLIYNQSGLHQMDDTLPTTTSDMFQEITNSGFKVKASSGWAGQYIYIAVV